MGVTFYINLNDKQFSRAGKANVSFTSSLQQKGVKIPCRGGPCTIKCLLPDPQTRFSTSRQHLPIPSQETRPVSTQVCRKRNISQDSKHQKHSSIGKNHDLTNSKHERAPPFDCPEQYQTTTTGRHYSYTASCGPVSIQSVWTLMIYSRTSMPNLPNYLQIWLISKTCCE